MRFRNRRSPSFRAPATCRQWRIRSRSIGRWRTSWYNFSRFRASRVNGFRRRCGLALSPDARPSFQKGDDLAGYVYRRRRLDSLQTGGGVDLQDKWTALGSKQVDPGDVQSYEVGGGARDAAFASGELHLLRCAAAMQVRTKLAGRRLPKHGGDDAPVDDETAEIRPTRLL